MRETPGSCLAEALRCEQIAASMPFGDPAKRLFERDTEWWLDNGARLERRELSSPPRRPF